MANNYQIISAASATGETLNIPVAWTIDNPETDFEVFVIGPDGVVKICDYWTWDSANGKVVIINQEGFALWSAFIARDEAAAMLAALTASGEASYAAVLAQFAKNVRVLEQVQAALETVLRSPDSAGGLIPVAVNRAGKMLSFDADGKPVVVVEQADITAIKVYKEAAAASANTAAAQAAQAAEAAEAVADDRQTVADAKTAVLAAQTDVTNKAAQVSTDKGAVQTMRDMVQGLYNQISSWKTTIEGYLATALGYKNAAETAKEAAEGARDAAKTSETNAGGSATAAATSANTAAAQAAQAAEAAEAVADDRQTVVDAKTGVLAAQTDVTTKAAQVSTDRGLVQTMRDVVQGLYNQISSWKTTIEGYLATALGYKNAAETAKEAAEGARDAAKTSETNAGGSATAAATSEALAATIAANMRKVPTFPIRGTNGICCSSYSSQGVKIFFPAVFDTSMGGNSIGYGFIIERDHSFEVTYAGIKMAFTKGANAYSMNLEVRQGDYVEPYAVLYTESNISVDFFNAIQAYWDGSTLTIKTSSGQIITREVGICSAYLDATEAYYSSSEFYSIFDFVVFGRSLDTEWGLGYSPDSFLVGAPDENGVRHLFKNFPHGTMIIPEGGGEAIPITDYFGPQVENIQVLGTEVGANPCLQFIGKEPVSLGSTTYAWAGTADAKQVCIAIYNGGCLKVDLKFNWRATAISLQVGYGSMVIDTINLNTISTLGVLKTYYLPANTPLTLKPTTSTTATIPIQQKVYL